MLRQYAVDKDGGGDGDGVPLSAIARTSDARCSDEPCVAAAAVTSPTAPPQYSELRQQQQPTPDIGSGKQSTLDMKIHLFAVG
jgi:hypothetical protein